VPGFVVTAVFVLDGGPGGGKAPLGPDVLAANLRPGHRFSYFDGRTLSVVPELVALHDVVAFETALDHIERPGRRRAVASWSSRRRLRLQRAVTPPGSAPPARRPMRARGWSPTSCGLLRPATSG
jgi:hypothetical protein